MSEVNVESKHIIQLLCDNMNCVASCPRLRFRLLYVTRAYVKMFWSVKLLKQLFIYFDAVNRKI